jgi:para-nitrobenzyl esterase
MSVHKVSAMVVLLLAVPLLVFAGEIERDVVQLPSGPVRGSSEGDVRRFLGIPFAAPPVGGLRWKPPQEVASWTDLRTCTTFAPACPQPKQQDGGAFSEDCLYLNVWTPAEKGDSKLPVMVWIHGGAFNFGSASLPEYDGRNLARKGVVVVTLNYRLGPLGFLVHPLLSAESARGTSGNYGLLDQIAALHWVQKSIAAFGGDAGRVTIFGQSAGSRSVSLLMISPLSAGLFHRAIAQSGGPILGSEYLSPSFNGDMANVSKMGQRLASRLGCDKAEDVLAAMRGRTAQEIVAAADCRTNLFEEDAIFFAPVYDSGVIPADPLAAYTGGRQHEVPLITGSTRNEGTIYLANETALSLEKYTSFLKSRFGEHHTLAMEMFPAHTVQDVAPAIDKILTVAANAQPARLMARSMAQKQSRAYLYHFTRLPDTTMARQLGVHHGADLAYVFGNLVPSDSYDDTDRKLSHAMMEYWVNFAKTGNPNGQGLLEWPAYSGTNDVNLEFSDDLHLNQQLFKRESDFITRMNALREHRGRASR